MTRKSFDFDWLTILLYFLLVFAGWLTIYTVSSGGNAKDLFDWSMNHGKQFIWICISIVTALVIMVMDNRFLEAISYILYGTAILLLLAVLVVGKEVNGARSWILIGGIQLQPAEFAKVATAMALARYMSAINFSMDHPRQFMVAAAMVLAPALIVILQNDTGSALVFGSFLIVFYREGLNPVFPVLMLLVAFVCVLTLGVSSQWLVVGILLLITGVSFFLLFDKKEIVKLLFFHAAAFAFFLGLSFSTDLLVRHMPQHQQNRIMVLFDPGIDPQGSGYNIIQSKIAIGSGGFAGKGFLEGNYTKYKFVPKQVTDFIYCTIGEEWGWLGTFTVVLLFFLLLMRIKFLAENSKTRYARVYGYGVLAILFFHVMVNIGMTIGLVPVIGIPLPFFSYGGSSLLSFTILIFILINHFSYRRTILGSKY
jgi:rod shape determining protein RodA